MPDSHLQPTAAAPQAIANNVDVSINRGIAGNSDHFLVQIGAGRNDLSSRVHARISMASETSFFPPCVKRRLLFAEQTLIKPFGEGFHVLVHAGPSVISAGLDIDLDVRAQLPRAPLEGLGLI